MVRRRHRLAAAGTAAIIVRRRHLLAAAGTAAIIVRRRTGDG
jgi:hypothetical protein